MSQAQACQPIDRRLRDQDHDDVGPLLVNGVSEVECLVDVESGADRDHVGIRPDEFLDNSARVVLEKSFAPVPRPSDRVAVMGDLGDALLETLAGSGEEKRAHPALGSVASQTLPWLVAFTMRSRSSCGTATVTRKLPVGALVTSF